MDFSSFNDPNDFMNFLEIIKNIPTLNDVDILCKSNTNFFYLDNLASLGYFNLLCPIQKYHLFETACAYESVDIAMLIYKNDIDLEGVKELMLNFLAEVGGSSEYYIFRWIWEKNQIEFTQDEIMECFTKILKTGNLEFAQWICSLNLINFLDVSVKKIIGENVLELASTQGDYEIAKLICEKCLENQINNHLTTSE